MDDLHDVMKLDSLQTSHPIYVQVKKPEEISEIFDKISYAKGASICRMVNFILSEGTFKRGLKVRQANGRYATKLYSPTYILHVHF